MFEERNLKHQEFQNKAIELFKNAGFLINVYGQETNIFKEFSNALYQCENNITAKFIRYKPDLALILIKDKKVYLCELKSSCGNEDTIGLEKNSYEMALLLSKIGVKIFILFGDFTYNFVENLEWDTMLVPDRSDNDIEDYKKKYPDKKIVSISRTQGSGTPFILVKKQCLKKLLSQI